MFTLRSMYCRLVITCVNIYFDIQAYKLRGALLKFALLFFYALSVTAVFQLTLGDHWIFHLLSYLVLVWQNYNVFSSI